MNRGRKLNLNLIIGIFLVTVAGGASVLGHFYTPYPVNEMNGQLKNQAPSLLHWFGTDNFGRDIFSRVLEGAATSFLIAAGVVLIGAVCGTAIGLLTAYFGGWVDEILMRLNDVLTAFPGVLLAIVLVAAIGPGTRNLILALGLIFIPSFARLVRSEVLVQKQLDYVRNARLMGAGSLRIMLLHILPNVRPALTTAVLVGFQNAVLSEASMSYLGLGVTQPDPSLGRMLSEAQSYLWVAPWYALAPGLMILAMTLGIGLLGRQE